MTECHKGLRLPRTEVNEGEIVKNKQPIEKITELESRLQNLEKRRRWKRTVVVAALLVIPFGLWAATIIPHSFTDGETLSAEKLNANFHALAAKIDAMEGKSWRLIYETDMTSATTSLDNTGLDGDTDHEYLIISRIRGGNGTGHYASAWNNTGANITTMRLLSSTTNGIGAGSHIEIWARR